MRSTTAEYNKQYVNTSDPSFSTESHFRKSTENTARPTADSTPEHGSGRPVPHMLSRAANTTDLPKSCLLSNDRAAAGTLLGNSSTTDRSAMPSPTNPHGRSRSVGHITNPMGSQESQSSVGKYSIIEPLGAEGEGVPEAWEIYVNNEERQIAARLIDHSTKPQLLAQDNLQPIVARLFEKNQELQSQLAELNAKTTAIKLHKTTARQHILSVNFQGILDEHDLEQQSMSNPGSVASSKARLGAQIPEKEESRNRSRNAEQSKEQKLQPQPLSETRSEGAESTASDSSATRTKGQSLMTELEEKKALIAHLREEILQLSTKQVQKLAECQDSIVALEAQVKDLTQRHNTTQQRLAELKNERREILAERDRFKKENVAMLQKRSNEQYERLQAQYGETQEQYQQSQDHAKELLRQRAKLLEMGNDMTDTLSVIREKQTDNQRAHQFYWEAQRVDAYKQMHNDEKEQEQQQAPEQEPASASPPGSTGTVVVNRDVPAGGRNSALRSRQASGAPSPPGQGLEASRSIGNKPLKERPGSIARPPARVRGTPKEAVRGSLSSRITQDKSQQRFSRVLSQMLAERVNTQHELGAGQIDLARVISQLPLGTRESFAWQDLAVYKYAHQDSPLSGFTPFFNIYEDPPVTCQEKARIRYTIRGPDNKYKLHEFKKGDDVLVYVDGMHDIWPVKSSKSPMNEIYFLPRNAIALVCDHGKEYKDIYEVVKRWPNRLSKALMGMPQGFLHVEVGERVYCAHSKVISEGIPKQLCRCVKLEKPDEKEGELKNWKGIEPRNPRGFVPANVLLKLRQYIGPPLTASLCPCTDPQPYTSRAYVLKDCVGSSGSLNLKEGSEVEVSHLDAGQRAYCVRDPKTKTRDFIDPAYLRMYQKAVHHNPQNQANGRDADFLELTPRRFDFMTSELQDIAITSPDMDMILRNKELDRALGLYGWSVEAERLWEENVDGTNPQLKKFGEEQAKSAPDKIWRKWELGPPDDYYTLKDDMKTMQTVNTKKWKHYANTLAFNPVGPNGGTHRARSRSVPALRNTEHLSESEQYRDRLIKRDAFVGHQPHRTIADGVCPYRDSVSEPVTTEPPDIKRRYIYLREDGSMIAFEAENDTDVHDLELWNQLDKTGTDFIGGHRPRGQLKQILKDIMPVEENVGQFSYEEYAQRSQDVFAYQEVLPEEGKLEDVLKLLKVFCTQLDYGLDLVYRLRSAPGVAESISLQLTSDHRFVIVDICEGLRPCLTIRLVEDYLSSKDENSTNEELENYNEVADNADRTYTISPFLLDPEPFLRTAVFKGGNAAMNLTPEEREKYQFVLIRKSAQESSLWDTWCDGVLGHAKATYLELEDAKHWKPLNSAFLQEIMPPRHQRPEEEASQTGPEYRTEFPDWTPQIKEWDFYYPAKCLHIGPGPHYTDEKSPDDAWDESTETDFVRVVGDPSDAGLYPCCSFSSGQMRYLRERSIDLQNPHLPYYEILRQFQSRNDCAFVLLKRYESMLYISLENHERGWVRERDLSFSQEKCVLIPLNGLVQNGLLGPDNVEAKYIEDVYISRMMEEDQIEPAPRPRSGEQQGIDTAVWQEPVAQKSLAENAASALSNASGVHSPPYSDLAGSVPGYGGGDDDTIQSLLADPLDPIAQPAATHTPAGTPPMQAHAEPSTPSAEQWYRSDQRESRRLPAALVSTTPTAPVGRTPADPLSIAPTTSHRAAQRTLHRAPHVAALGTTPTASHAAPDAAPDIPHLTKPVQQAGKPTSLIGSSIATNAKAARNDVESNDPRVESMTDVVHPSSEKLVIDYDDWREREEQASNNNASTNNRKGRPKWVDQPRRIKHDTRKRYIALLKRCLEIESRLEAEQPSGSTRGKSVFDNHTKEVVGFGYKVTETWSRHARSGLEFAARRKRRRSEGNWHYDSEPELNLEEAQDMIWNAFVSAASSRAPWEAAMLIQMAMMMRQPSHLAQEAIQGFSEWVVQHFAIQENSARWMKGGAFVTDDTSAQEGVPSRSPSGTRAPSTAVKRSASSRRYSAPAEPTIQFKKPKLEHALRLASQWPSWTECSKQSSEKPAESRSCRCGGYYRRPATPRLELEIPDHGGIAEGIRSPEEFVTAVETDTSESFETIDELLFEEDGNTTDEIQSAEDLGTAEVFAEESEIAERIRLIDELERLEQLKTVRDFKPAKGSYSSDDWGFSKPGKPMKKRRKLRKERAAKKAKLTERNHPVKKPHTMESTTFPNKASHLRHVEPREEATDTSESSRESGYSEDPFVLGGRDTVRDRPAPDITGTPIDDSSRSSQGLWNSDDIPIVLAGRDTVDDKPAPVTTYAAKASKTSIDIIEANDTALFNSNDTSEVSNTSVATYNSTSTTRGEWGTPDVSETSDTTSRYSLSSMKSSDCEMEEVSPWDISLPVTPPRWEPRKTSRPSTEQKSWPQPKSKATSKSQRQSQPHGPSQPEGQSYLPSPPQSQESTPEETLPSNVDSDLPPLEQIPSTQPSIQPYRPPLRIQTHTQLKTRPTLHQPPRSISSSISESPLQPRPQLQSQPQPRPPSPSSFSLSPSTDHLHVPHTPTPISTFTSPSTSISASISNRTRLTTWIRLHLTISPTIPIPLSLPHLNFNSKSTSSSSLSIKPELLHLNKFMLGYMLLLLYFLFETWVIRQEWKDVNGIGGVWGVQVVRGGRGRWVWGKSRAGDGWAWGG